MIKEVTNVLQKDGKITHVKVDGDIKTRSEVIKDMDNNSYVSSPFGTNIKTPIHKTKSGWISTNPNDDTRDNLDSLPGFSHKDISKVIN